MQNGFLAEVQGTSHHRWARARNVLYSYAIMQNARMKHPSIVYSDIVLLNVSRVEVVVDVDSRVCGDCIYNIEQTHGIGVADIGLRYSKFLVFVYIVVAHSVDMHLSIRRRVLCAPKAI